jgi:N-hydroxyarylamine O-acetyltransferase
MCGSLKSDYLDRLGLRERDLDEEPTLEKLAEIQEAHLKHIPFENLAQHGCDLPASLDIEATAKKILHVKRGGFCFELNALLSEFLLELGYQVTRVPAIVYNPEEQFDRSPSHLGVFCNIDNSIYFVDVAFGEPAIHPLILEMNTEQTTAEGMISRFVENEPGFIDLQFYNEEEAIFKPRIRFQRDHILSGGFDLPLFAPYLNNVYGEQSPFVQKLVCCRVTRTHKYTVAGNRLKVTTPRFGDDSTKTVTSLDSDEIVRQVLRDHFGIPYEQTKGLDTGRSSEAKPDLWMA